MLYLDLLFLIHPKMIEETEFTTCWEQVIDSSHNTVKIVIHKISNKMSQNAVYLQVCKMICVHNLINYLTVAKDELLEEYGMERK